MVVSEKEKQKLMINEQIKGEEYSANIYGGIFSNTDFNLDLDAEKGFGDISTFGEYEKIAKTDGLISGILNAINSSIISADIKFVGGKEEHRKHLESVFFDFLNPSFQEFLQQVLQYLIYGFMVFEIVHEKEGKYLYIKKLSQRHPRNIYQWNFSKETNELESVTQQVYSIDGFLKEIIIPSDNLLIFTHRREGNVYIGNSSLRSSWNLVHKKQHALKVWAIANQREGAGIPYADRRKDTLDSIPDKAERDQVQVILREMQSHQRNYLIGSKHYEFKYLYNENKTDFTSFITQLDMQIALSFLAQFFLLGNTSSGNRSLSETQQTVFDDFNTSIANYIASIINGVRGQVGTGITRLLIDYTWGLQEEYPKLVFSNVKKFDAKNFIENLSKANDSNLITIDKNMIQYVHEVLDLPKSSNEPIRKSDNDNKSNEEIKNKFSIHDNALSNMEKCFELVLTEKKFDSFENCFRDIQIDYRNKILSNFSVQATKIFDKEKDQKNIISKIRKIPLSDNDRHWFKETAKEIVLDFVSYAEDELEHEIKKQIGLYHKDSDNISLRKKNGRAAGINTINTEILIDDIIEQTLEQVEARANAVGVNASIEMIRTGIDVQDVIKRGVESFKGQEEKAWAGLSSSRIFNTARENHIKEIIKQLPKQDVKYVEYSAIMDKQTCEPCANAEKENFRVIYGSEEHKKILPPYTKCKGSLRCRCILLYVL